MFCFISVCKSLHTNNFLNAVLAETNKVSLHSVVQQSIIDVVIYNSLTRVQVRSGQDHNISLLCLPLMCFRSELGEQNPRGPFRKHGNHDQLLMGGDEAVWEKINGLQNRPLFTLWPSSVLPRYYSAGREVSKCILLLANHFHGPLIF